jgi:hypothetical protein
MKHKIYSDVFPLESRAMCESEGGQGMSFPR